MSIKKVLTFWIKSGIIRIGVSQNLHLFNRSQQRVILFLIASSLIASCILVVRHRQRENALSKIEVVHSAFEIYSEEIIPEKVNLNTASLEELISLPKIGTSTAKRIIKYRQTHNGFQSIKEITRVKGIGSKSFEKIKEMITVGSITLKEKVPLKKSESLSKVISEVGSMTINESNTLEKKSKININIASMEELDSLPGIGPAIANRIIEYRESHGNFQLIEEITKVKGIGVKTFEKIKGMITVKKD